MSQFQNKNNSTEKSAKSIDEAIAAALAELGADRDEIVDIERLDEGSKGFLGIGARDARVRVTVKAKDPKNAEIQKTGSEKYEAQTEPEAEPIDLKIPSGEDDPETAAKIFLENLFAAMGLEVNIEVKLEEDMLNVNLQGDNMGIVIGKRGDTLDSLQYLTSLVANRRSEDYIKVTIDTENYREKRTQALITLSDRLAAKVARTGKKFTLEPMNPYERRIIHSNLQDNEAVTTFSVGSEPYRKVVIAPKNRSDSRRGRGGYHKKSEPIHNKSEVKAEKTGSYTTTYKADFKPTPHKAEYKTYAEYLAAQNGEIIPPMNKKE